MANSPMPLLLLGAAALLMMRKKGESDSSRGSQSELGPDGVAIPAPGRLPRHGTYTDQDGSPGWWQSDFIPKMDDDDERWGWSFWSLSEGEAQRGQKPHGGCCYPTEEEVVFSLKNDAPYLNDVKELDGDLPWPHLWRP